MVIPPGTNVFRLLSEPEEGYLADGHGIAFRIVEPGQEPQEGRLIADPTVEGYEYAPLLHYGVDPNAQIEYRDIVGPRCPSGWRARPKRLRQL
jgi:hypothetical protein